MNENQIKKAFDSIEPKAGAQERMYANILKKAEAQQTSAPEEKTDAPAQIMQMPARRRTPPWKRYGALAACLALVVVIGLLYPRLTSSIEENEPPVMGGSPFEDASGPEDFEKLGFTIDAPEGAENLYYCIFDGEIARVDFTLDGHEYSFEAAKLDGNFSRAAGEAVSSTTLNAEYNAVLDRVSADTWRAHWSRGGVSYYLTNFDGADEENVAAVADSLLRQE